SSLYPVDEWKKIRSENVRKKGMQHHLETRMVKKDGKFIDIDISISVLKGPDGKITGSIGVMRDITERKRNEEQLQQAEQTYRTIFENSAVAITVTDDNERVISWNKFAEDLLGMSREDLYMKPVSSFYSKEEWDRIRGENIRQKGMQNHLETVMIKKNNEKIDVDISISVLKGPDGKITGSIGVIRDITERKNAEKQLKMAEERYRTIFESSAVAITVTDEDENIISWNSAAEVLLAMDNDDLYMKPVSSLYSKSEWTRIRSQSVREKGAQNHIETRIINKKKQLIDVDLSVKVLKDADGRVTGSIGVLTDIRDVGEFKKIQENYEQLVAAYRKQSLLLEEAGITPPESPVTNVDTGD
ncbi:MAG: PAS domain S-box protein, partial [bacterium]|nr:PAS domain S-box protein [bacterium]